MEEHENQGISQKLKMIWCPLSEKASKRTAFQRKKMRERHNRERIFALTHTFRPCPPQGKFFR